MRVCCLSLFIDKGRPGALHVAEQPFFFPSNGLNFYRLRFSRPQRRGSCQPWLVPKLRPFAQCRNQNDHAKHEHNDRQGSIEYTVPFARSQIYILDHPVSGIHNGDVQISQRHQAVRAYQRLSAILRMTVVPMISPIDAISWLDTPNRAQMEPMSPEYRR